MHNINIRMILLFKNIRFTFLHVYYVTEEGTAYVNVCPDFKCCLIHMKIHR